MDLHDWTGVQPWVGLGGHRSTHLVARPTHLVARAQPIRIDCFCHKRALLQTENSPPYLANSFLSSHHIACKASNMHFITMVFPHVQYCSFIHFQNQSTLIIHWFEILVNSLAWNYKGPQFCIIWNCPIEWPQQPLGPHGNTTRAED
jgi:hypothetical protein